MDKTFDDIKDMLKANYPLLYLATSEYGRALQKLRRIAYEMDYAFFSWDNVDGLQSHKKNQNNPAKVRVVINETKSLVSELEPELRARGIAFERIDGSVKRRAERVRRFQEDPDCRVFLISLKAGGVGLNLTAASYVFLLDPWWNPAVELQAIDRAHRIGQKRVVNAYRLVCRDTVEERVLELQSRKKALCEAILGNERSLLQDLTRADLELLLG
jgi:SNF2 family DNA or RNA helicase